jgi:hypothetical protein
MLRARCQPGPVKGWVSRHQLGTPLAGSSTGTQLQLECSLHLLLSAVLVPYAMHDPEDGAATIAAAMMCLHSLKGWVWLNENPVTAG